MGGPAVHENDPAAHDMEAPPPYVPIPGFDGERVVGTRSVREDRRLRARSYFNLHDIDPQNTRSTPYPFPMEFVTLIRHRNQSSQ